VVKVRELTTTTMREWVNGEWTLRVRFEQLGTVKVMENCHVQNRLLIYSYDTTAIKLMTTEG
jgi:hypothetical protein